MSKVDRHGCIDFRIEGWVNVQFDKRKDHAEIQGCSINCLLNGLFLLNGYRDDLKSLPGESFCWDAIIETMYITLMSTVTTYELLARVRVVVDQFLTSWHYHDSSDDQQREVYEFDSNMLYGTLTFLYTLVANFNSFITDSQLTLLRNGVVEIGALGLRDINAEDESMIQDNPLRTKKTIYCCGELYRCLDTLLDVVTTERCILLQGKVNAMSFTSEYHNHMNLLLRNDNSWHHPKITINKGVPSTFRYYYHSRNFIFHSQLLSTPSLNQIRGEWIQPSTVSPRLGKLIGDSTTSDNTSQPQISAGMSLLQMPRVSSSNEVTDLWAFELIEIARQWTVCDHALFCKIPLHSMLTPQWSSPRNMLQATEVRMLMDRFQAFSLWITASILSSERAQIRAQAYASFVSLMEHLVTLGNYNGAMAILTALQQGCISRLVSTLSLVSDKDKDYVEELKKQLSPLKNFHSYRVEVCDIAIAYVERKRDLWAKNKQAGSGGYGAGIRVWTSRTDGMDAHGGYSLISPVDPTPIFISGTTHDLVDSMYKSNTNNNTNNTPFCGSAKSNNSSVTSGSGSDSDTEGGVGTSSIPQIPFHSSDPIAVVPYLGAHLAELTAINDGNPEYLPEAPHLLNIPKKAMIARCLSILEILQSMTYQYSDSGGAITPVRLVSALLHKAVKPYLRLSTSEAAETGRRLFERSLALEPDGIGGAALNALKKGNQLSSQFGGILSDLQREENITYNALPWENAGPNTGGQVETAKKTSPADQGPPSKTWIRRGSKGSMSSEQSSVASKTSKGSLFGLQWGRK